MWRCPDRRDLEPPTSANCPGCSTATPSSTPPCSSFLAAWPTVTAATSVFSSASRCHDRLRGVCRLHQRGHARRIPAAAGRGGRTAHADLARLVLASYPPEKRHGAVRAWTATGGLAARWARSSGSVGRCQLAVGVPGQRTDWYRRVDRGLASLAPPSWPSLPPTGRPGSDSGHRGRGRADPRPGPRKRLGLGVRTNSRDFGRRRGADRGIRAHCASARIRSSTPAVPLPPLQRSVTGGAVFLRRFRSHAAVGRLVGAGRMGWSAFRAGLAIAPGPLMVPLMSFVVAGRLIARTAPLR